MAIGTTYTRTEPKRGWGRMPWGSSTTSATSDREFLRGWGGQPTRYTNADGTQSTTYWLEEPRGFGTQPFGQPENNRHDKEFRTEGFGDPTTRMSEYVDD